VCIEMVEHQDQETAEAEDEQARESLLTAITSLTFLLGMAAIVTDIDEDMDTKVDAKSMAEVTVLGQVVFNLASCALILSLCTYACIIYLSTRDMKTKKDGSAYGKVFDRRSTARVVWIIIGVIFSMFLTGIFVLLVFFMKLTNYRGRGPDICPIGEAGRRGKGSKPYTLCGVTGFDLHSAAKNVCEAGESYSEEFKNLGFKTDVLCTEYLSKADYTDEPDKQMFESMFVWNSPKTDYTYRRSEKYFELVDQATATYCQKDVAWSLRNQTCKSGSRTNGVASLPDKQLCAVAMEAALAADVCQSSKKADVESCYMHCAGKFRTDCRDGKEGCPTNLKKRPTLMLGAFFDDHHSTGVICCVFFSILCFLIPCVWIQADFFRKESNS